MKFVTFLFSIEILWIIMVFKQNEICDIFIFYCNIINNYDLFKHKILLKVSYNKQTLTHVIISSEINLTW